jgi:predicted negative regulator of RcsB-dependent stress response
MALDLEEQEQLEELKEWWKKNGKWVMALVIIFLLATAGWRGWQAWSYKQGSAASMLFDQAMQATVMNNVNALKEITGQIMDKYSHSGYATPAAWLVGRINFDAGDLKSAQAQYRYALDHAKGDGLKDLARLRLAAVLLDDKDPAGALALLNQSHADAFAGLYAQLKGDVLMAQGKKQEARAAYQLALAKLGDKDPLKPLVEIKLDGIGG